MFEVPAFLKQGMPCKESILDNTIFGFNGCNITLHGVGCNIIGQVPDHKFFWLYEDDQNWMIVNGRNQQVLCCGQATCVNNQIKFLDNLTGTIEWS